MPKQFTIHEVAEHCGVSVATVLCWIRRGELEAICVSKNANSRKPRYRISESALTKFSRSRTVATVTEGSETEKPKRKSNRKSAVVKFY